MMTQQAFVETLRQFQLPKDFVLVSALHQITDWEELCRHKKKTVPKRIARWHVLVRMAEVLPTLLPNIHDWEYLERMLKQVEGIEDLEKPIKERISEIAQQVTDLDKLLEMRKKLSKISDLCGPILQSAFALLRDTLPGINNWSRLIQIRDHILDCPDLRDVLDDRMREVLSTLLLDSNNWDCLVEMRDSVSESFGLCEQIEERMAQLIAAISLEYHPDWFISLMQGSYLCHTHKYNYCLVKIALDQKVGELKTLVDSV